MIISGESRLIQERTGVFYAALDVFQSRLCFMGVLALSFGWV